MIALIHDQFEKLDLQTRMNAANAYSYLFKDKKATMKAVLAGLDAETAEKVYTHPKYGMDRATKLYYWAAAVKDPEYYALLSLEFLLTPTQMEQIVGPSSMLDQISVATHYNLKEELGIKGHEAITPDMLFARQWGSLDITNTHKFYINDQLATFSSIKYLAEDEIDYYPEVAAYSQEVLKQHFASMSADAVMQLFAEKGTSRSLLNQVNVRKFFHEYESRDYSSIMKRFGFTEVAQCQALYEQLKDYPKKLVTFQDDGGSIEFAMMQRMVNMTQYQFLEQSMNNTWMLKELAKRYVYTDSYNKQWNCK